MISVKSTLGIESHLQWAEDYLRNRSVPNPNLDAKMILCHVLGCEKTDLYIKDYLLNNIDISKFKHLICLRGRRYPLQYIIGSVNFMGLKFKVMPGVFIPRPETELMVETTIRYGNRSSVILDLCTGCGNIAISLTKFLKTDNIIASDISGKAITVTIENMALNKCEYIKLIKSDLFDNIDEREMDIIVSNPHYVSEEDYKELMPELFHEPREALYGGKDGLQFYRSIFEKAQVFLKKGGYLIMEIGYNQASHIIEMPDTELFDLRQIIKDDNNIDRVVVLEKI